MKTFIRFAFAALFALMITAPTQAGDKITYYHNDALGSPVAATNQLGQVIWRETYKPYGERTTKATASANNTVWFTGKPEESALGINYFGARWYHPEVGRFLIFDPANVSAENIHSFNRYGYANDNPFGFVDPDGRDSQEAEWAALGESPPSARMVQAAANVAAAGKTAADVGDAVMPHNAVEAALPFALGKLLKIGKAADTLKPGPFAKESIPGHLGRPTADEQRKINELMKKNGCHTCGTKDPGTKSGNAIADHQPPQALGDSTVFLPHCNTCKARQGGQVVQEKRRRGSE